MRVLILEDSKDDSLLILRELKQGGFEPDHLRVETRQGLEGALAAGGWDIIIADYIMPGFNAPEALRLVQDQGIDLPFIIVSGSIGEETAVEAMQAGARDYLMKGNLARLPSAVARELEEAQVRQARLRAEEELRAKEHQLSYIFSNVSEVIYYLSVEGDERFRFLSVNQSFLDVTGLSEDQVVGKYVHEVIPEPSLTLVLEKYRQAIRDNQTVKWEEVTDYPAGRRYGEVTVTPVCDAGGVCTGLVGSVHDLTERVAMEESLRESEEQFRFISEQSLLGIQIIQDGLVKYANEATARICGYPIEEIMTWGAEEYAKLFYSDDLPILLEQARRKQAGEKDLETNYEWRLITRAGETRWIESFSKSIHYGEGPADFVMITDVTERKHAEEALKTERDKAQRYLDIAGVMLLVLDAEARVVLVNKRGCEILGYEEGEIVGQDWIETLLPEGIRKEVREVFRAISQGDIGPVEYYENSVLRKDGEERIIAWHNIALQNEKGAIVGTISSGEDITERKRTMERLEKLNQCFLSLGPDPRENVEKILAAGRDILGAIERIPPEEKHPDVDGAGVHYPLTVPIKIGDNPVGSLCLFDTEEREFTMEERELLAMLARAIGIEEDRFQHEESLRDFLAVAAHELRHPICLVQGYANTLLDFRQDMPEEMLKEVFDSIGIASRRLTNLVEELLEVSRIEKERFVVDRCATDPERILRQVVEEMRGRGVDNPFEVKTAEGVGTWPLDPDKFRQLMVILLDNAVNYSPPGSPVEVELEKTAEGLSLSVLDRGRGVSADERDQIFQRFYQVEDTRHHSVPGLGLGLYIAREIVEGHGGRIWCEDRPGAGSAFRIILPR